MSNDDPHSSAENDELDPTRARREYSWCFRPLWSLAATLPAFFILLTVLYYPIGWAGLSLGDPVLTSRAILLLAFLLSCWLMGYRQRE